MADFVGSGYMGDATSGIGQGLAFVLPEGKAQTYAMQLAQTHASQLQDLAKQKALQQQKQQLQYEKDFKDQELPKIYAPFDDILRKRQSKWLQDGATTYANTGKNPYNDPDFTNRHSEEILGPAAKSTQFGEAVSKVASAIQADKTDKYSDDSKKAWSDWYDKFQSSSDDDKMDYLEHPDKHQMPTLKEKELSSDDLIKSLKTSGDPSYNNAQVFAAATGDPKWKPVLQKYGYNTDLPDFGVYTDPAHATGKRVWYTNPVFTGHQADLILDAPTDPRNKKILDDLGIHPDDQYAKEKLQHAITDQNAAMGKFVSENGARLNDPEKTEQLRRQQQEEQYKQHEQANSDKRLALSVQEHKDLQAERKQKFEATPPFDLAAANLKQAAQSGDYVSAKKYADGLVEHFPSKKYKDPINTNIKDGILTIHVPKEHIPSGNGARAYDIQVDVTDPNFESVLWAKLKGAGMDIDGYNKSKKGGTVPGVSQEAGKKQKTHTSLAGWNQ